MLRLNKVTPPPHLKNGDHISLNEYRRLVNGKELSSNKKDDISNKEKQKQYYGPKFRTNMRQDYAEYKEGVLRVVIHEIPPSQNSWKCWHWSVLAEHTATWNAIITGLAMAAGAKYKRPIVKFNFYWPSGRNYDTKNFASWKPLLDGLTRAGTIPDDNYKVLKETEPGAEIDRENPRTEIIVREA